MKIANTISQLIGNTPLLRLNRLGQEYKANILVKLESNNPSFSVKDRLALALIENAEEKKLIGPETVIIEPTSGNTGIGLAMICAERGYKLIITMPESASIERRSIIKAFGAEIVLTSAESGMKGAIARAHELKDFHGNAYIPYQFINTANPQMHRRTTGPEIWNDTEGSIDIFVAGVGTGGTITGVAEMLKTKKSSIKAYAVEPADSPVLSGGLPGKHKIQGIGAGFIPDILNKDILDGVITVSTEDAMLTARRLMREEGILCGISSGANVWSAIQLASKPENKGKTIVTIVCDTGERYLSTDLFKID
ncbi:MAG: cysteine synthase A [Lentimicrobiaceae bacterium]|nr:cysteine synthase A [Lentimicrobiaceae bacterium]